MVRTPLRIAVWAVIGVFLWPASLADARRRKPPRKSWRLRTMKNLRDAGQIGKIPLGHLYRSDDPRYRPNGSCETLKALGIRRIIRLNAHQRKVNFAYRPRWRRGACRIKELRVALPHDKTEGAHGVTIYHLGKNLKRPARARVLKHIRQQLTITFKELAKLRHSSYPILVNCSYGRDRTGVLVALLQSLAGAKRADIMADYMASKPAYHSVQPRTMRRLLRRVGKVFDYLHNQLGLSKQTIWRIQYYLRKPIRRPRPVASGRI